MTTNNAEQPCKTCFIVGPIGKDGSEARKRSDLLLRYIIRPTMQRWPQFEITRADKLSKPGMIDRQIITQLRDADLVIADLATSNPNAFYEIGIRHMVERPIVHIQQADEQIPFDVSLYRAVHYALDSVENIDRAINELTLQIEDAIDPNHEIDNPVTRALGQVAFSQSALPGFELIHGELAMLREIVESLHEESKSRKAREKVAAAILNNDSYSLANLGKGAAPMIPTVSTPTLSKLAELFERKDKE
ncbi:hypothetical protein FNL55_26505 [Tardiphaga sp. vice352]|uniref:hypothetical protein n=1 Tax=unclassified Tardiphaga TaxID=2631404 RepID=UPI0011630ECC|nr:MULTISPECIES: hypothetical protein [unclassified Tardiphaga]QDM19183.1 hypothetical protein FNL53_27055 [Tardiphaga sp. vice278]QDM34489.1 hypothetical protein FNL55_26505 [Tardiphaga sp. vice352]